MDIYPVIVCIAKMEHDYIEEFVKYHLALGFKHIYLYDNEDEANSYNEILKNYMDNVTITHLPGFNNVYSVLGVMLHYFRLKIIPENIDKITHAIHIDLDEFIVLKKHKNICDFIKDYIKDDCSAIAMNWRFFGSSGHKHQTNEPLTQRFTKCEEKGNFHVKVLFDIKKFKHYITPHYIELSSGYTKTTNGDIVEGSFNHNIVLDVIQLNHYKCKTLEEYKKIRPRGRVDQNTIEGYIAYISADAEEDFKHYDLNEIEELTAMNFYKNI